MRFLNRTPLFSDQPDGYRDTLHLHLVVFRSDPNEIPGAPYVCEEWIQYSKVGDAQVETRVFGEDSSGKPSRLC